MSTAQEASESAKLRNLSKNPAIAKSSLLPTPLSSLKLPLVTWRKSPLKLMVKRNNSSLLKLPRVPQLLIGTNSASHSSASQANKAKGENQEKVTLSTRRSHMSRENTSRRNKLRRKSMSRPSHMSQENQRTANKSSQESSVHSFFQKRKSPLKLSRSISLKPSKLLSLKLSPRKVRISISSHSLTSKTAVLPVLLSERTQWKTSLWDHSSHSTRDNKRGQSDLCVQIYLLLIFKYLSLIFFILKIEINSPLRLRSDGFKLWSINWWRRSRCQSA